MFSISQCARNSNYDGSVALNIRHYFFKNELLNGAYLFAFLIAFATHSIWLAHCAICPNIPLWYNLVYNLPVVTRILDTGIIMSTLGALLIAISVFVIEGLSNSNSSIKSKVLLNESEIIPFVVCFVIIVFSINNQTRVTILLPLLLFTIHIIIKFANVVSLLRHPSRLEVAMQRIFVDSIIESIQIPPANKTHSMEISEIQELLNEQKTHYLNALSLGDTIEVQRRQHYIELALQCFIETDESQCDKIIKLLDVIATTVNQLNNPDEQKVYIRFIAKLYVYTIRNQSDQCSISQQLGVIFWKMMWGESYTIRTVIHQQLIVDEIIRQFSGYIVLVLIGSARDACDDATVESRFYNILDIYSLLICDAIQNNSQTTVEKLVHQLNKWMEHSHHLLTESNEKQTQHTYHMVRMKDNFLLLIQSVILTQAITREKLSKELFEIIPPMLASSPLFPYLQQSIIIIEKTNLLREFTVSDIHRLICIKNTDREFIFHDKSLLIYTAYMMIRTYLRKSQNYVIRYSEDLVLDASLIDIFTQNITNVRSFINKYQRIIHQYAELTDVDIDEILKEMKDLKVK